MKAEPGCFLLLQVFWSLTPQGTNASILNHGEMAPGNRNSVGSEEDPWLPPQACQLLCPRHLFRDFYHRVGLDDNQAHTGCGPCIHPALGFQVCFHVGSLWPVLALRYCSPQSGGGAGRPRTLPLLLVGLALGAWALHPPQRGWAVPGGGLGPRQSAGGRDQAASNGSRGLAVILPCRDFF